MRRLPFVLFAFALGGLARATPLVSPRVRMAARGQLPTHAIGIPTGALPADERALVTVRIAGGAAALLGFDARPLAGDVAEVRATAADLARLVALPGVLAVEERRLLSPTLDQSAAQVGAPAARAATGLDGTGALVGIVDTGVDFRHADLRHADGSTRVAALLDVSIPRLGRHLELPDYGGRVWLAAEIDAVLAAEAAGATPANPIDEHDTAGHGTHVAGIAVSNGRATGLGKPAGRYVGMAPGAELIVAQATRFGRLFTDTDVIASCRFALDRAQALGRPIAVNLSLGGIGGPHDGTSNLELALASLFPDGAPGRALVIAAGNLGRRDLHAGAWQPSGELTLPMDVRGSGLERVAVEIYYRGALAIGVRSPSGASTTLVTAGGHTNEVLPEGVVALDNASAGVRDDGLASAGVVLGADMPPGVGTWRIRLAGSAARVDAWIVEGSTEARFVDHVAVDERVALPATCASAITVGSFVTKNRWTDAAGEEIVRATALGDLSEFSSPGPTADGRFSPDLIAPGDFIVSSLSRDTDPGQPSSAFFPGATPAPTDGGPPAILTVADDGVHGLLRGTSQATPHVTGVLALLFQANPLLTSHDAREILRSSAADGAAGYSTRAGFGRLDARAALALARGVRGGRASATASSVGTSRDAVPPSDEQIVVSVTPRDDAQVPLGPGHAVTIELSAGEPTGPVEDLGWGRYERRFFAHATRGTIATASAAVDGVALDAHPRVWFVIDRSEIGRPFVAGGGCSPVAPPSRPAAILVVALLALALGRATRRARRSS